MDTLISRKNNKKKYLAMGALAFLFVGFSAYTVLNKKRNLNVLKSELSIQEVTEDYFEDFMTFQAQVEPLNSVLVNVVEGGSVQEIYVNNGDQVRKGQPLVRLYNPNTELNYMQQETAIIEQINNLNKAKLDLRNQELGMAKDLIGIEHDYQDAHQLYELNKKLYAQEIIAKNEWERTQENYRFQKERMDIIKQSIAKEKQANRMQISQMGQSVSIMQKSLEVLRKNKQNFLIVAPETGRLTSFEPVIGKTYEQGQPLAKIDVMKGYKLIAQVDEFYLEKLAEGQKGTVEFGGKILEVQISKVIAEVKSGRFQVELNFLSPDITGLRQGLSFGVRLNLSAKTRSLVLPKGAFYAETSGQWIFVVHDDKAERRNIKLGRDNPLYYEVISGLKVGDRVITSQYKDYKDKDQLTIEN